MGAQEGQKESQGIRDRSEVVECVRVRSEGGRARKRERDGSNGSSSAHVRQSPGSARRRKNNHKPQKTNKFLKRTKERPSGQQSASSSQLLQSFLLNLIISEIYFQTIF